MKMRHEEVSQILLPPQLAHDLGKGQFGKNTLGLQTQSQEIGEYFFQLRSMHLQGDGLYTALLIKVFAYLLALRLQAQGVFSKLTLTEIMRQLRREADLRDFLATHFHAPFSIG